ncbi:hypothetical protein NDU88_006204 [Pleurodeles waltl]|uniref:Uncharacterized protein n=1 Tax=Pleurodeles waltl TaxID=8319 RepID=A0AAV7PKE3_PLEWA|nr:hypothetical protein NDU88_006204 [Pleurodeles waltl]
MRVSARVGPRPEVSGPSVTSGSLVLPVGPLGNVVPSGPVARCEEGREDIKKEKEPGIEGGREGGEGGGKY